jgi:hypothetical protein
MIEAPHPQAFLPEFFSCFGIKGRRGWNLFGSQIEESSTYAFYIA